MPKRFCSFVFGFNLQKILTLNISVKFDWKNAINRALYRFFEQNTLTFPDFKGVIWIIL